MENIIGRAWPEWETVRRIGGGSFGVVYEGVRSDYSVESHSAVKVITIPRDESEMDSLRAEGLSAEDSETYLEDVVNDCINEIKLMLSFKGVQNIVSVEDYKVVKRTEPLGWDIYIRMELLKPLDKYFSNISLTEQDVIQLGIDICTALEYCGQKNVIHRDIKPENIFVNQFGDFKLGDFGIARKLENRSGGLSQKGTYNYMAPEISRGESYGPSVDQYSLGMVLYRLLNRDRLPFLDTDRQILNPNDRAEAISRRMSGEPLPAPCDASPGMAEIILRACAFDPDRRFASATEMKEALMRLSASERTGDETVAVRRSPQRSADDRYAKPVQDAAGEIRAPRKKKGSALGTALVIAVTMIVTAAAFFSSALLVDRMLSARDDTAAAEEETEAVPDDAGDRAPAGEDGEDPAESPEDTAGDGNAPADEAALAGETVEAPETEAGISGDYILLCDLEPDSFPENNGLVSAVCAVDNQGTIYGNALYGRSAGVDNWNEYLLDGTYSLLTGRVVLNYDFRDRESEGTYVTIYGDEEELFRSEVVTAGMEPEDFSLSLEGITVLKVVITGSNYTRLVDCALSNGEMPSDGGELISAAAPEGWTTAADVVEASAGDGAISLGELSWSDSSDSDGSALVVSALAVDNMGNSYDNVLFGLTSGIENWNEYELDGAYTQLSGRVVLNYDFRDVDSEGTYVYLYGDGEELFRSEVVTAGMEPEDFTVDLTGVDTLRVVIVGSLFTRLVNCVLTG